MIFWFSARHGSHWLEPAAEEPVEVVEPPAVRPTVEGARGPLLPVRRQVPLAERRRAVAVVPKDPGQWGAVPWQDCGIAWEAACELADRAEPDCVVVPPGEQRGARGGAQGRHVEPVVLHALLGDPRVVRRLDRSAERAGVPEAGVIDQDQQHVGRTLRRRGMPDQVPVRLRAVERPVRAPAKASRRIGRLVRSGIIVVVLALLRAADAVHDQDLRLRCCGAHPAPSRSDPPSIPTIIATISATSDPVRNDGRRRDGRGRPGHRRADDAAPRCTCRS